MLGPIPNCWFYYCWIMWLLKNWGVKPLDPVGYCICYCICIYCGYYTGCGCPHMLFMPWFGYYCCLCYCPKSPIASRAWYLSVLGAVCGY